MTYNRCHKGKEGDEDIEIARHILSSRNWPSREFEPGTGESAVAMELRLIEQTLRNRGKVAAAGTLSISSRIYRTS